MKEYEIEGIINREKKISMGLSSCVRERRTSFVTSHYYVKCLKCKHRRLVIVMYGCVHSRTMDDGCPRCKTKKYEIVRNLTKKEIENLDQGLHKYLRKIIRKRNEEN